MFIAASLILTAGISQAQSQQQTQQQNQQQTDQKTQPQSQVPASSSQNSSGQSGGSSAQGTAQGGSQDSSSSQSQPTSPGQRQSDTAQVRIQPQTENDITYMCGGVGEEQEAFMKQSKGDYDLMLTFATRTGAYLADVDVAIKDAKGKQVLNTKCGAPILLVNLPRSGKYQVEAQAEDYSLHKTVKVNTKKHPNAVVMSWPRETGTDQGVATTGSGQDAGSSGSSGGSSSSGNSGSSGNAPSKK